MRHLLIAVLLLAFLVGCGPACSPVEDPVSEPAADEEYQDAVFSDCRSWLLARVPSDETRERISLLKPAPANLDDLALVLMALEVQGVTPQSLKRQLRWREIAERMGVDPMEERWVVIFLMRAARDLVEGV